jgi:hypothetical protein
MMLIMGLFLMLNGSILQAKETDLFDEIINKTRSNVVEYGVSSSYITNDMEIQDTLRTLGYYDSNNTKISENADIYTIDFIKGNVSGFIQATNENNQIYVTIDVREKSTVNNINMLKKNIENAVDKKYKNVKYYFYLKSKVTENNLSQVNDKINKILKNSGAKNIDTVEINNGFSTVAYTKRYETVKNNGVLMDLNYAVTSYDSGNYIIIGTPTIKETY